ncbi:MAG TPA: isochorismatase family protein [Polyangiaceae bacterium]|jgi:protein-tyrosine phosphatase/nicotinamidase-related amidase/aminoglycoside phosphotransferase (APT) family kinase protein|nr:isochorismatase family protein [Polyangiaceae bacterium]
MKSILITDCLQHDFVGSIGPYDSLPNALHVGHDESRRLLGEDPSQGPLARAIGWAHSQSREELVVIHVRDWHEPSDPQQSAHLEQFGAHCVKGSDGAQFVFSLDGVAADRVEIVNATTLSNFVGADLGRVLERHVTGPVRIGLMGVWTEAKITFLAYDIVSRYPNAELAVCSALTASSSRQNHFLALAQLQRILGVRVLPAVGDFIDFLGGALESAPLIGFSEKYPEVTLEGGTSLGAVDLSLLRYLFRGCRSLKARSLDGGFSGNAVLGTTSSDFQGHEQVPHVVKIGARGPIAEERMAFERIESVLGNCAPRVTDFADLEGRGAIKYRYAAMGRGPSRSFQRLYQEGADQVEVERILDIVFDEQLGRFYTAATLERIDLLSYYAFKPDWAPNVRARVAELLGASVADQAEIDLPCGRRVPNIARFYTDVLPHLPRTNRAHYLSQVHGDLNGANIIVDAQRNVWLIDFFHSHRGHVLRDLAKFENDVLYIFSQLQSEADLEHAFAFTDRLLEIEDLARPLTDPPDPNWSPALKRAFATVGKLRSFYPGLIQADRNPEQLHIAQIRYAVHTLSFEESSRAQKLWALYTACRAADELRQDAARERRLRVDWLPSELVVPGALGLTLLPGRKDFDRNLDEDIQSLSAQHVDAVVCLLSPEEFRRYGVDNLLDAYRRAGFDTYHQPILDGSVPSPDELDRTVSHLLDLIGAQKRVVVHCVGGLGRAGTIAACTLRARGLTAEQAIGQVRSTRSARAIETRIQEQTIAAYAHSPLSHTQSHSTQTER